jgi:hypothetical protein
MADIEEEIGGAVRRIEKARACLGKIRDIADRGMRAADPANVGYALQELTQVLCERTGDEERYFEPVDADQIGDLDHLWEELEFVNGCSQGLDAGERGEAWRA